MEVVGYDVYSIMRRIAMTRGPVHTAQGAMLQELCCTGHVIMLQEPRILVCIPAKVVLSIDYTFQLSYFLGARSKTVDYNGNCHGNRMAGPFSRDWARFSRRFRDSDPFSQSAEVLLDFHLWAAADKAQRYAQAVTEFSFAREDAA